MSLSLDLKKIKSSGLYRFVYDKSQIPPTAAEEIRLCIGYSNKGPFNAPVYFDNNADFETAFGKSSKKLEKKGIFFHRLCKEALYGGEILALNLKPFSEDNKVDYLTFNMSENPTAKTNTKPIESIYNTERFWKLDADKLPEKLGTNHKYFSISATDEVATSCSIVVRKAKDVKGYDLTFREWYGTEDIPDYVTPIIDNTMSDYFADVYVFRGQFLDALTQYKYTSGAWVANGLLSKYFTAPTNTGTEGEVKSTGILRDTITNAFGQSVDALAALAEDSNSNYVVAYSGITLPEFKDQLGNYISLDIQMQADQYLHKLLCKFDDDLLADKTTAADINTLIKPIAGTVNQYYQQVSKVVYWYDQLTTASTDIQNNAVEYEAVPTTVDADDPKYIKVEVAQGTAGAIKVGDLYYLFYQHKSGKKYTYDEMDYDSTKTYVKVTTIPDPSTTKFANDYIYLEGTEVTVKPVYLAGYTYDNNAVTIDKCLEMLNKPGILEALTNHVDSEWRYLVDTFGATITEINADSYKVKLAELIKKKDNAFGIINFPAMDLITEQDKFKTEGKFDIKKVATSLNLPSEAAGASWVGYYTQYVISDGTVKTTVPSAGAISNNFMEKYRSRLPYNVVAGPTFGVVTADGIVGPDYNFSRDDLDVMEPKGINCLVYQPRYGTYINSNQTAKQTPVSALSKVHIRELVIYLQDEIETLLRGYQWELNTASLRATIKTKADALLENIKGNGGVYEYLCVCDETNNDSEVIDNEMVVLDISIEPGRAAGKMVQRLYIYRTGQIATLA